MGLQLKFFWYKIHKTPWRIVVKSLLFKYSYHGKLTIDPKQPSAVLLYVFLSTNSLLWWINADYVVESPEYFGQVQIEMLQLWNLSVNYIGLLLAFEVYSK